MSSRRRAAQRVAGVDEVGRGAWAGPVVVCAVIARTGFPAPPDGLTDSKRLTARRRAQLAAELPAWVECYAIGEASHEEIDALGMTAALRRAAVRALDGLASPPPDVVLLDGSHDYIGRPWPVRCAVKADLRSVSVAAASVLAKVHRDNLMAELGRPHAEFAFEENAGYPSPAHQRALASLGPTPYHRLSWSYLDDLPEWRHLKKTRPDIEGQLSLLLRLGTVISVILNERRRLFLRYTFASMAAVAVAGAAGVELISRGRAARQGRAGRTRRRVLGGRPRPHPLCPARSAAIRHDPFYPGVQALARVLPKGAIADFTNGCHDGSFFTAQEPLARVPGPPHSGLSRRREPSLNAVPRARRGR